MCPILSDSLQPHQASLSMGFSRQEYWSGLPFPYPRDLPDPGIKPTSSASPALAHGYLPSDPLGKHFCPSHILVKHGRTDKV